MLERTLKSSNSSFVFLFLCSFMHSFEFVGHSISMDISSKSDLIPRKIYLIPVNSLPGLKIARQEEEKLETEMSVIQILCK